MELRTQRGQRRSTAAEVLRNGAGLQRTKANPHAGSRRADGLNEINQLQTILQILAQEEISIPVRMIYRYPSALSSAACSAAFSNGRERTGPRA